MNCYRAAILLAVACVAAPVTAQQPQRQPRNPSPNNNANASSNAERWIQQLENDLDHLQEEMYYERGNYPKGLREQADDAAHAVAHFHQKWQSGADQRHLREDFREMDEEIHRLVNRLDESNDPWLRRQASRINYSDEQLHYVVERKLRRGFSRELLERHTDLLGSEVADFQELAQRVARRDNELRNSIREFADEVEHFQEVVEDRSRGQHIQEDFQEVDEAWHRVVKRLNRSTYAYYLRRAADNVNRVHNQIHDLLNDGRERVVSEPVSVPANDRPPQRVVQPRPAVQFEIPGVGRFVIPQ